MYELLFLLCFYETDAIDLYKKSVWQTRMYHIDHNIDENAIYQSLYMTRSHTQSLTNKIITFLSVYQANQADKSDIHIGILTIG